MAEIKHIINIISDIVDNIRDTSTIINIVDNLNNTYTFTVSDLKNLEVNGWLKISDTPCFNSENEKIISIDSVLKSFTISKISGITITSFGTYKANTPYFDFGFWVEESNKLTLKGQSKTFKNQKFPLIFLELEIKEDRNNLISASEINGLRLHIITNTKEDSFSDWRLENTFIPILRPLYRDLLQEIADDPYIYQTTVEKLQHGYEEKHLLGILEANQTVVNQWVDAIFASINLTYKIYGGCN